MNAPDDDDERETTMNATQTTKTAPALPPTVFEIKTPAGVFTGANYKEAAKKMRRAASVTRRLEKRAERRSTAGATECYAAIGRMYCHPDLPLTVAVAGGATGFELAMQKSKIGDLKIDGIDALALDRETVWAFRAGGEWHALGRPRKDESRATMKIPEPQAKRLDAAATAAAAKRDADQNAEADAAAKRAAAKRAGAAK